MFLNQTNADRNVCWGSFASIPACPRHVRFGGNLGNVSCLGLLIEGIGLDVIQSPRSALRNDPTGKSLISCPAPWKKIFWFSEDANQYYIPTVPSQTEGRLAIVTNAGRDAVDADALLTNGA